MRPAAANLQLSCGSVLTSHAVCTVCGVLCSAAHVRQARRGFQGGLAQSQLREGSARKHLALESSYASYRDQTRLTPYRQDSAARCSGACRPAGGPSSLSLRHLWPLLYRPPRSSLETLISVEVPPYVCHVAACPGLPAGQTARGAAAPACGMLPQQVSNVLAAHALVHRQAIALPGSTRLQHTQSATSCDTLCSAYPWQCTIRSAAVIVGLCVPSGSRHCSLQSDESIIAKLLAF